MAEIQRNGAKHGRGWVVAGIVVVVIIAIAAWAVLGSGNGINIGGATKLELTSSPKAIVVDGHQYMVYVASASSQLKSATLYVKSVPVFAGQSYSVTLVLGNSTHVNLDSTYSDLNLVLDSINGTNVVVTATPVDPSLGISPNSQYIQQLPQSLLGVPAVPSSVQPTTTIAAHSNSSSAITTTVTSTAATTTIAGPAQNQTYTSIISSLKASVYYGLMQNYSKAYALGNSSCNYEQYNTAFSQNNGGAIPLGPNTYSNVTAVVPYNVTMLITSTGHGNYDITYYTKSHSSVTTGQALVLGLNLSSLNIISAQYSGVFAGQTTAELTAGYAAIAAKGACGAYLV
jgi:hypothetical protein